nr:hypothetical protein [Pseudomonas oleovorans]
MQPLSLKLLAKPLARKRSAKRGTTPPTLAERPLQNDEDAWHRLQTLIIFVVHTTRTTVNPKTTPINPLKVVITTIFNANSKPSTRTTDSALGMIPDNIGGVAAT